MNSPGIITHPIISCVQKIAVYETKARLYLMGSNNTQTRFRILKIDRTDPKELVIIDDNFEYSKDQIKDLVKMIDVGNRPKAGQRGPTAVMSPVVSAFGIVGFVRFLEGYYLVVVTKRRRVAMVGHHTIYKIVDTNMIYIPNDGVKQPHPDEQKYYKMFQSIDLSSNFYFSYSYDITNTLQSNMTLPRCLIEHGKNGKCFDKVGTGDDMADSTNEEQCNFNKFGHADETLEFGVRNIPNRKFVWNSYLLSQIEGRLHPDWILYIVHGFVGQSNVSVFGRPIYVTLIARRSNKFAGTRFLKRGANFDGDVANEVETEQMVHDSGVSSLVKSRFSSFVQMRGSVPAYWSQDVSKMVPKPAISFNISDPYAETAGKHFNDVLRRYGSPIIVLNLVKKREKKRHESALSENLKASVDYLNQFLSPQHHIVYLSFDMARMNKVKEANVMAHLGKKAYKAVCKVGIFQSQPPLKRGGSWETPGFPAPPGHHSTMTTPLLQTGIVRVNCVDCLDRTNTAQFALGKCALGLQLCALGILDDGNLEFDTDCVRMLENLYEDHGDTLALQYGGSQLVHRIRTYRKTAPWTSQGNDIMTTLSRYYRNTFSDAEKQHTMNLFLGLFIPEEGKMPIWEQVTDYYLHHPPTYTKKRLGRLTQWWDKKVVECLPRSCDEVWKECAQIIKLGSWVGDDQVDAYLDYYRPHEFSVLSDDSAYKISHSVRDFMPHFTTNFSPFTVRVRPGRRREESSTGGERTKNPSLTGQSSTSSTNSSDDSSTSGAIESSEEEDDGAKGGVAPISTHPPSSNSMQLCGPSVPMGHEYDLKAGEPSRMSLMLYKRYSTFGRSTPLQMEVPGASNQQPLVAGKFPTDSSSFCTAKPHVPSTSIDIYRLYIERGMLPGARVADHLLPLEKDLSLYKRFVSCEMLCSS